MPTTLLPYLSPPAVTFYLDESKQAKIFELFNPHAQSFFFKVDNEHLKKYKISRSHGVIKRNLKEAITITCISNGVAYNDCLRVRFYRNTSLGRKCSKSEFLGYKVIWLNIQASASERERAPSEFDSVSLSSGSRLNRPSENLSSGSNEFCSSFIASGDSGSTNGAQNRVFANIILVVFLALFGYILKTTSKEWFKDNVMEADPETLATVFFTLAIVLFIKLLTFR